MKPIKMISFELHGSQQGKATGWMRWPGFTISILSDGRRLYGSDGGIDDAIEVARKAGVDVSEIKNRVAEWVKTGIMPPAVA
jgi:hypothetical protein